MDSNSLLCISRTGNWSIGGLYHISETDTGTVVDCVVSGGQVHGSGRMYHISKTGTGAVVDCVVSGGMVWDSNILCRINRTGTGELLYSIVYIVLVLG